MPWIVDGDNLLGARREDEAKRELARRVARFSSESGRRVLLVFDGPAPAIAPPGEVLWSGPGRRADDRILETVGRSSAPRGWTVVTDDRSLADRCRALGARVARPGPLRGALAETGAGREKPDAREDLAYWEEIFGTDPGDR